MLELGNVGILDVKTVSIVPIFRYSSIPMSTRYKMTIAYDGTDYAGWQIQPRKNTVQAEIERVLHELTGKTIRIHHSGRTDAGVHAKGQVAHFDLDKPVEPGRFQNSLNALLKPDVRIMKLQKVKTDFHARFSAVGKEYRYFIWNGPAVPPELRLYRLHERRPLDINAMREAAEILIGKHDFAAFTANPNREIGGTVKTVTKITVTRSRQGDVQLCVVGEGFLYKMVRSIAGFLLRVGVGELDVKDARRLLKASERTNEIPTAKPHGLFLWKVDY
jgi:tRNA pseudouridine38-40 synthase